MSDEVERKALKWLLGRDTGVSSKTILAHMLGISRAEWEAGHPWDPADFGRCERLLAKFPEWRERLPEMSKVSPVWAALVRNWGKIRDAMDREVGIDWSKGREAPATYQLMSRVISAAQAKDTP